MGFDVFNSKLYIFVSFYTRRNQFISKWDIIKFPIRHKTRRLTTWFSWSKMVLTGSIPQIMYLLFNILLHAACIQHPTHSI